MDLRDKIKSFKIGGREPQTPKYEFEIVVLKPGINIHTIYVENSMEHEHPGPGDIKFKVKPENLFKVSPGILDKILYRIRGIDSKFLVIFQEDADTPISYETPKYNAQVLKTVSESEALSKALKDEFAKDMNFKTMFMYFMLIVGAGVVFLVVTGQINLGG